MTAIEVEGSFGPTKYSLYALAVDEMLINARLSNDDEFLLKEFKKNVGGLNNVPNLKPDITKFTDSQLIRIIRALNDYKKAIDSTYDLHVVEHGDNFINAMNRRIDEEEEESNDDKILNEFDNLLNEKNNEINKKYNLEICHSGHDIWVSEIYGGIDESND